MRSLPKKMKNKIPALQVPTYFRECGAVKETFDRDIRTLKFTQKEGFRVRRMKKQSGCGKRGKGTNMCLFVTQSMLGCLINTTLQGDCCYSHFTDKLNL